MMWAMAAWLLAGGGAVGEDTEAFVAARIAALNRTPAALKANFESLSVQVQLPGGEKKKASEIKLELAGRGVSIRVVDGKYVDVSNEVANGHVLEPKVKGEIAIINCLHEEYCRELNEGFLVGEREAYKNAVKKELEVSGTRLKLRGDLFVVDSGLKRKGDLFVVDPALK